METDSTRETKMKKILFVTTRNVLTSSGELRLIKNRAEALFHFFGIITDFIVLQKPDRIASKNKECIDAGGEVMAFPAAFTNPIQMAQSFKTAYQIIKHKLDTGNYGMIIFSGHGFNAWPRKIKKFNNLPIVFDIHGANEDLVEVAKKSGLLKAMALRASFIIENYLSKNYLSHADGALVVTKALEDYTKIRYRIPAKFKFYTVPCATSSLSIDAEHYLEYRKQYRKKYGISDDEIVFIYSGGISPWQCIEETILLYKRLQCLIKQKSRLIIFSFNIDSIMNLLAGTNTIFDSYTPDKLVQALCAGDYAMMLRHDNLTNNVAFPNKYLEYVQSGMSIITTTYVYEIAEQIKQYDLGVLYDMSEDISKLVSYIDEGRNKKHYNTKQIDEVLTHNSFKERLKSLAEDLI